MISTLGVPFAKQPVNVYSDGMSNIVHAMHAAGVKRLVAVTSSAIAPHPEPLGGFLFERVLQPYVVNKLGRTVYDDMRRMEAIITESDLIWTIVRPSGLCSAPRCPTTSSSPTTSATASPHVSISPTASYARPSRTATPCTAIAVATPSAHPSMLR